VINAIRAHLAELGIVAPVGRNGVEQLLDVVADSSDNRLPNVARESRAATQDYTPPGPRSRPLSRKGGTETLVLRR
jgi:hypothetical protein